MKSFLDLANAILFIQLKKFWTLKNSPCPLTQSIKVQSPGWFFFPALFPAIAVKNPQENLAILNTWLRNVTTSTRKTMTRAWMAQFVLKIEKLSHTMGPRGSQDLRSPSPIMVPACAWLSFHFTKTKVHVSNTIAKETSNLKYTVPSVCYKLSVCASILETLFVVNLVGGISSPSPKTAA